MTLRRRFAGVVTLTSFVSAQLAPGLLWAQERTGDTEQLESVLPEGRGTRTPSTSKSSPGSPLDEYDLPARRLNKEEASGVRMGRASSDAEDSTDAEEALPNEGADIQPLALPSGDDKSGVTSQTISLPKGSGSIQGMEESFSAQLSTGIATFSLPFALPRARGGAQPSLGLSYSSASGRGAAGQGWSLGVPFIARQTDRGIPKYADKAGWHPEQDRFVFNGGQELVPICTVGDDLSCTNPQTDEDQLIDAEVAEVMPAWAGGHQYFRPRVEGSFLRFFWSRDHKTWRVQDKSGTHSC